MYNRYLQDAEPLPVQSVPSSPQQPASSSNLFQNLSARLGELKLDTDTLIAIAVIWFLLSDGNGFDSDLLIIIAVLLILGI